jgi:hypothetical protein
MHPFKFKNDIVCIVGLLLFSVFIVFFTGCSQKKAERKAATTTMAAHAWTDTIIGSWYVRIHSPEPGDHPGIWDGPVEIGKKPGIFSCTVDTSLIRGVRLGHQDNILIIEGFSGNRLFNIEINVDSCIAGTNKEHSAR